MGRRLSLGNLPLPSTEGIVATAFSMAEFDCRPTDVDRGSRRPRKREVAVEASSLEADGSHDRSALGRSRAGIGIHHVHHLSGSIPSYRLPEVMRDDSARGRDRQVRRSLRALHLALRDENQQRLVSVAQLR